MKTPLNPKLVFRAVLFFALLLFMVLGPSSRQVFNQRIQFLRPWVMFNLISRYLFDLRYTEINSAGQEVPFDRYVNLGYTKKDAPRAVREVKSKKALAKLNRSICKKNPGKDIRLYARQAQETGWVPYRTGEENICDAF